MNNILNLLDLTQHITQQKQFTHFPQWTQSIIQLRSYIRHKTGLNKAQKEKRRLKSLKLEMKTITTDSLAITGIMREHK